MTIVKIETTLILRFCPSVASEYLIIRLISKAISFELLFPGASCQIYHSEDLQKNELD